MSILRRAACVEGVCDSVTITTDLVDDWDVRRRYLPQEFGNVTRSYTLERVLLEQISYVSMVVLGPKATRPQPMLIETKPRTGENRNQALDPANLGLTVCPVTAHTTVLDLRHEIARYWLDLAKLYRKNGNNTQAYSAVLASTALAAPRIHGVHLERAKQFWAKGEHQASISVLCAVLDSSTSSGEELEGVTLCKTWMYKAKWLHVTGGQDNMSIIDCFNKATKAGGPKNVLEKVYFHMARFFDDLFEELCANRKKDLETPGPRKNRKTSNQRANNLEDLARTAHDFVPYAIKNYGKALMCGVKHIYHSLPRLVTLWLDYAGHFNVNKESKVRSYDMCRQILGTA